MRNGVLIGLGVVILIASWSEIIAAIGALMSVIGVMIVYAALIACIIGFIGLLLGYDGESEPSIDGEPVYRG